MAEIDEAMFQFHKVRLKEMWVSLPAVLAVFQFHKVRLKANREKWERYDKQVSIPQGTIKSPADRKRLCLHRGFNSTRYD